MRGSEWHRLLVVSERRPDKLAKPHIMLAVDHKGRLECTNTELVHLAGAQGTQKRKTKTNYNNTQAVCPEGRGAQRPAAAAVNTMHSKRLKIP